MCLMFKNYLYLLFFLSYPQDKVETTKFSDNEDMGDPDVKFGECICFLQHVDSGLWVTYKVVGCYLCHNGNN